MLCDASICTGCRACAEVCPTGCIQMLPDREGFLAPAIDAARCTGCGLCQSRCPQLGEPARAGEVLRVYAAKHRDPEVLGRSASGGASYALTAAVLAAGGFVYGCAYDDAVRARQTEVASMDALAALFGSKYVQSDPEHTYRQAKARLEQGAQVLYTGTPCQIAGLIAYLGKPYEALVCVELLCEGVPSPALFAAYLEWRGAQLGEPVERYAFRVKDTVKWGISMAQRAYTRTRSVHYAANTDPYMTTFLKAYTLRECCYHCRYNGMRRAGDITICDYWGIETQHPAFHDAMGVSGLTVNSAKGMALLERARKDLVLLESSVERLSAQNAAFFRSKRRPAERDKAYAGGIHPEMFRRNPVFRPTLFDYLFTAIPRPLKPLAKRTRRRLLKWYHSPRSGAAK